MAFDGLEGNFDGNFLNLGLGKFPNHCHTVAFVVFDRSLLETNFRARKGVSVLCQLSSDSSLGKSLYIGVII